MDINKLQKLDKDLDKAIDIDREQKKSKEDKSFLSGLLDTAFTALINVFKKENKDTRDSLSAKLDAQTLSFDKSIKSVADKKIEVNVPEIKIPKPDPIEVKLPVISVPKTNIQFDTKPLEKAVREGVSGIKPPIIKIPKPEVTVNLPEMDLVWPKETMQVDGMVGIKGVGLDSPMPVQLRDSKGKPVKFQFDGGAKIGHKSVNLENKDGVKINPATEDKQDDIVTAVNNVSGLQRSTDMYGGGKNAVGSGAEVEVTITGTPESIIIKADPANTGYIYVGKTGVTNVGANALTYLNSGDEIILDYDDTTNAIYVIASAAAQNVWWGALL